MIHSDQCDINTEVGISAVELALNLEKIRPCIDLHKKVMCLPEEDSLT